MFLLLKQKKIMKRFYDKLHLNLSCLEGITSRSKLTALQQSNWQNAVFYFS